MSEPVPSLLQRDLTPHLDMLAKINGPHAAGAEAFEQAILVGDEKATPTPGDQFFRLEVGEDPFLDEGVCQLLGRLRFNS